MISVWGIEHGELISKEVSLQQGKGQSWKVRDDDRTVGRVKINEIDHPQLGRHASLQIALNQKSRGRGIGSSAYRMASEQSQHDTIHLHMRKSNIASRKAAEHAGYRVIDVPGERQRVMRWDRKNKVSKLYAPMGRLKRLEIPVAYTVRPEPTTPTPARTS